jgi:hypothetical protein
MISSPLLFDRDVDWNSQCSKSKASRGQDGFVCLMRLFCNGFWFGVTTMALPLFRQSGVLAEQAGVKEWRM